MTEEHKKSEDKKPAIQLYATMANPNINAAVNALFSFATQKQADDKLQQIKKIFATSKQGKEAEHSVIIWIRGYDVN